MKRLLLIAASSALSTCVLSRAVNCHPSASPCVDSKYVAIGINGGIARITLATLEIKMHIDEAKLLQVSAPAKAIGNGDFTAEDVSTHNGHVNWTLLPLQYKVSAYEEDGRLAVSIHANNGTIQWPTTTSSGSLLLPRGPGLHIPTQDTFWNSEEAGLLDSGVEDISSYLNMPFWGYQVNQSIGFSYILPEDIGTTLSHTSINGQLALKFNHTFQSEEDTLSYKTLFELNNGSLLAPAMSYRKYLLKHQGLVTLKSKIQKQPNTKKLLGAFHTYVWGPGGLTVDAMHNMTSLGIKKLWIGYDANGNPMTGAAVGAAQDSGYLVGPYDTWANGQDPKTADSSVFSWPEGVYTQQCVMQDGEILIGFGSRGCYLSSQAQKLSEPHSHNIADRIKNMSSNGVEAYFLDVDAASELYTDSDPKHAMNQKTDRQNRLERLTMLSEHFVVGSEEAHGWSNSAVAYGHGSFTPVDSRVYPELERNTTLWGKWYPVAAPGFFFQEVQLLDKFVKTMFDPVYRLPLTEAVMHDSIISLDRWEMSLYKFPNVVNNRILLSMLYNCPLMLSIDGAMLQQHGSAIAKYQNFFQPLHELGALVTLDAFSYLTDDQQVQRTEFGSGSLIITANFGNSDYNTVKSGCVKAELHGKPATTLCV
ncbi:hypothetical protein INT43_000338 [Umbelopsis isabellina]|uniref:Alpha-galactosidase n=1 Tax=Mortierella isabellina TaxID=91625 RepID=A0A8H7Q3L7_MORIS|nr:hypothetical protein INT43_000338 [Umbelopsis isabellina]